MVVAVLAVEVRATTITSLLPTSGPPGTQVTLLGSINTAGGGYFVTFAGSIVASGSAFGEFASVQAKFTIPDKTPPGTYNVILYDATNHTNISPASNPAQFTVVPNQVTSTITITVSVPQATTHVTTIFQTQTTTRVTTTTQTQTRDLGSVVIGAVAGAGVVGALMSIIVFHTNSVIKALKKDLSQIKSRIQSQSPTLGSFNVQVRSGVRRMEDQR